MAPSPRSRGQLAASIADRVITERAAGRDAEEIVGELSRLCDEAGVDPELLLEEARRRARRKRELAGNL